MASPAGQEAGHESSARSLLERLGIAEDPVGSADPVSFLRSLLAASVEVGKNPSAVVAAQTRLALGRAPAPPATRRRASGPDAAGPVSPGKGDKRFAARAYGENPAYFLLQQQYLLAAQMVE